VAAEVVSKRTLFVKSISPTALVARLGSLATLHRGLQHKSTLILHFSAAISSCFLRAGGGNTQYD
jgi:hypothetical protein